MSKEFNYGNALLVGAGLVGAYLIIKNYKGGSADDSALGGSAGGSDLPLGGGLEEGLVGGSYTPQESNIPIYNPVIGTIEDPTIKAIIEQGRKESITEPSKILNNIDAINFLGMDITPIKETENKTNLKLGSDIPAYRDTVLGMGETVDLIALGIPSLLPSYGTSLGKGLMKGEIFGFEKRAIAEVPLAGKFVLNTGKQTIKSSELSAIEDTSKTLLKDIGKRSLKTGISVIPALGLSAGTIFDVYNRPVLQTSGFKNKKGNPNIGAYAVAGTANLFGDVLGGAGAVAGAGFGSVALSVGGQVGGESLVYGIYQGSSNIIKNVSSKGSSSGNTVKKVVSKISSAVSKATAPTTKVIKSVVTKPTVTPKSTSSSSTSNLLGIKTVSNPLTNAINATKTSSTVSSVASTNSKQTALSKVVTTVAKPLTSVANKVTSIFKKKK